MAIRAAAVGTVIAGCTVVMVQAGDLPVLNLNAVDPVSACEALGPGYMEVPNSQTCIQVSTRVRTDYNVDFDLGNATGSSTRSGIRNRANVRASTVTQTEFGPLSTYVDVSITKGSRNKSLSKRQIRRRARGR